MTAVLMAHTPNRPMPMLVGALLLYAAVVLAGRSPASPSSAAPGSAGAVQHSDEIFHLPGLVGDLPSRHFAGYITVDATHGRRLWYYLAQSERSPEDGPVILWLTGGPGCSTLDAFIYEHGPFRLSYDDAPEDYAADYQGGTAHGTATRRQQRTMQAASASSASSSSSGDGDTAARHMRPQGGAPNIRSAGINAAEIGDDYGGEQRRIRLDRNPHSWSSAATVIYVDSPAATGLSYSTTPADYATNDTATIADLHAFLCKLLFEVHPRLAGRDLYIAGESYAGVYVPLLAEHIAQRNAQQPEPAPLRLVGYLVGNAVTDDMYDGNAAVPFAYGVGLLDVATYQGLQAACREQYWNATAGSKCAAALDGMDDLLYSVNPYDISAPCTFSHHGAAGSGGASGAPAASRGQPPGQQWRQRWRQHMLRHVIACADRAIALDWLNRAEVRRALHAVSVEQLAWTPCSDVLRYTHDAGSMLPLHRSALQRGLRVMVYSGDRDLVVPFTGTRAWVHDMRLAPRRPWQAWMLDGQVAGFWSSYYDEAGGSRLERSNPAAEAAGQLVFATVKGAGHMLPQTHPAAALELLLRFLNHEL